MTTRLSREELCAVCESVEEDDCAEVFETMCGAGCDTCSGLSCAGAAAENARVNVAAARTIVVVRMNAALRGIALLS